MTTTSTPISATSNVPSGTTYATSNTHSSTADIISSFKQILTLMTATSSMSTSSDPLSGMGSGMGAGMNMSDLMAPLMMLMMERLLEQELNQDNSTANTNQISGAAASAAAQSLSTTGAVYGSKPEPSGRPVEGGWVSQDFHPGHTGIDIAVPVGTNVKATMDGKVIHAGWNEQGYGNLVIVENGNTRTYYAHLSSIPVSVGDQVTAGMTIGLSGNTGHSTGPHLHYEIRKNKVPIDPAPATLGANA